MPSKIYAHPTSEPISLEEAKLHLIIDQDDTRDDSLIYALITAARQSCEAFLGRALITQTWDLYLNAFPCESYIKLLPAPLQAVTHVKYKDTAGVLQTLDTGLYIVDTMSEPGKIHLAYGQSWPSTYSEVQAVQIRFVCGYGVAASVPQTMKQAMLLKLTDLHTNRGDAERAVATNTLDQAVEALLWPDRVVPI